MSRPPIGCRYRRLMKGWRRLQRMSEQGQVRQRRRLLEELRALEGEAGAGEWSA